MGAGYGKRFRRSAVVRSQDRDESRLIEVSGRPPPARERPSDKVSVTIATDNGGCQRTFTDGLSQARQAAALAVRACTWLRDEEANASERAPVMGADDRPNLTATDHSM